MALSTLPLLLILLIDSTNCCCRLPKCLRNLFKCRSSANKTSTINQERPFVGLISNPLSQSQRSATSDSVNVHFLSPWRSDSGQSSHDHSIQFNLDEINSRFRFEERKSRLRDTIHHFMDIRASLEMHRTADSILLVLNGRHTIFDSICGVTRDLIMELNQQNAFFFESTNHNDTINVIRPGLIEFLQTLDTINGSKSGSGSSLFQAILYLNHIPDPNSMSASVEIEELLSVLTFIEIQYNRLNPRREIPFEFEGVIFREKYYSILKVIAPIDLYAKTIIVDHEGKWGSSKALRHPITRRLDPLFDRFQERIVPIRPKAFKFGERVSGLIGRDAFHRKMNDDFMRKLCGKIEGFCRQLPDGVNFVDHWISNLEHPGGFEQIVGKNGNLTFKVGVSESGKKDTLQRFRRVPVFEKGKISWDVVARNSV